MLANSRWDLIQAFKG